ncbi:hypothetical protein [Natronomonas marina]|jgi:hypothetical protein|uniref:hypothetical protein n=1 Tax=Natronomonas marina TaxID=2961939 RepID=UPI0020C9C7B7|nr:hypothetical protein [Natronomonas marina]
MPGTAGPGDGDPGPGIDALRRRTDGSLYSVVRFDPDDFEVLYVGEETYEMYPTDDAMFEHFERIFDYVGIDFAEKALFTDVLFSGSGSVQYMTTCLDSVKVVRLYAGSTGVFLGVDPAEPVPPLVDVVETHLF